MVEMGSTYLEMAECLAAMQRKNVSVKRVHFNGNMWVAELYS